MAKILCLVLALLVACSVAIAEERTVIVPSDNKPFSVEKSDLVRLTGKGIAGSKIEIKVNGPAKVEATSSIREFVDGKPTIGHSVTEFDVKPTSKAKGRVFVTITVTPPQPGAKAVVTEYEFVVK